MELRPSASRTLRSRWHSCCLSYYRCRFRTPEKKSTYRRILNSTGVRDEPRFRGLSYERIVNRARPFSLSSLPSGTSFPRGFRQHLQRSEHLRFNYGRRDRPIRRSDSQRQDHGNESRHRRWPERAVGRGRRLHDHRLIARHLYRAGRGAWVQFAGAEGSCARRQPDRGRRRAAGSRFIQQQDRGPGRGSRD